jgi:hypothetical protein
LELRPALERNAPAEPAATSDKEVSGMAGVQADQPTSRPSAGWLAVAGVALIASAVAANTVWIFASQGLRGPGGGFFHRLLALLGGGKLAAPAALAAGVAGAFLLYAARWPPMLRGPGRASPAPRHARVLLSVAVSAMLVAIPAHGFFYMLPWPAACEEFCGLPALFVLAAAGAVALTAGSFGLALAEAEPVYWVRLLAITSIVEPWVTVVAMNAPAMGVLLNTSGIAGLLVVLAGLVRARPTAIARST